MHGTDISVVCHPVEQPDRRQKLGNRLHFKPDSKTRQEHDHALPGSEAGSICSGHPSCIQRTDKR